MTEFGIAQRIAATLARTGSIWLESAFCKAHGIGALLFSEPIEVVTFSSLSEIEPFFRMLEAKRDAGYFLAGWLAYEAGYGFEPTLVDDYHQTDDMPLGWFGVYREPERLSASEVETLFAHIEQGEQVTLGTAVFNLSESEYVGNIAAIKEQIAAGNVYQVNFTGRYHFTVNGSALGLFAALRGSQPSSYTVLLNCGTRTILSFSPELFFEKRGSFIETMPMKGTAPRGCSDEEDLRLKKELGQCSKNLAENLMIVDLLRNDLGRICKSGSVQTASLFATETWPTLHQMHSTIRGELRDTVDLYDLFRALYPCGSITGAPKVSAMKLIQSFETEPRGIYTGALGFIEPNGNMLFNVAIRTVELVGQQGTYGSGGGIVWDSDAQSEYRECQLKAKILATAGVLEFDLFESMLWHGNYLWLEEHLVRLAASALALDFVCDIVVARAMLNRLAEELRQSGNRVKVKLSLSHSGAFSLSYELIEVPSSGALLRLAISEHQVDSSQPHLYHKTTMRELYNSSYALAREQGYDEVIFCNERGEVTEGAISNLFIRKGAKFFTPPMHCGLLHGIFRSYFLATRPFVVEKVLTLQDVLEADIVYVANSVRGLRAGAIINAVEEEQA